MIKRTFLPVPLLLLLFACNFFLGFVQKMRVSGNLTILHDPAPAGSLYWRRFTATEDGSPIYVCVSNLYENFDSANMNTSYEAYDQRRLAVLKKALKVAEECPVILYTGLMASDIHSPCGCYGYDVVCDYHRNHEYEVAKCFCCKNLNIDCSYHTSMHSD